MPRILGVALSMLLGCSCSAPPSASTTRLTVAAASNLTGAFDEIASAFRSRTGVDMVLTYGSTAQFSQQVENGASFDIFAAADTEHIDALVSSGKLLPTSRAIYARGQLAVWIPESLPVRPATLNDLTRPEIRFIAIAQPELAPYGRAAVETLQAAGLWEMLQPKLVYANSVNMARQYATTGNADVAFTAYSLVSKDPGSVIKIDPKLHSPLDQALGIVATTQNLAAAQQFVAFLASTDGKAILRANGYTFP